VDTAVKTAETGYMQRRLVKSLEDLAVGYDNTVRTSAGEVVQFVFGEDGLDPSYMEGKGGELLSLPHCLEQTRPTNSSDGIEDYKDIASFIEEVIEMRRPSIGHYGGKFMDSLKKFLLTQLPAGDRHLQMSEHCPKHRKCATLKSKCALCDVVYRSKRNLVRANCLSRSHVDSFVDRCISKFMRAIAEPGSAVGAIAATSIGEPSTQMTLKTFHFAGVASMNITQGVPRIKEIINSVSNPSTPIINVALKEDAGDEETARKIKAKIEKTTLGEISEFIEQSFGEDDAFIRVRLSPSRIEELMLQVTLEGIEASIRSAKLPYGIKIEKVRVEDGETLLVWPEDSESIIVRRSAQRKNVVSKTLAFHTLKYSLPDVVIKGLSHVTECVVHKNEGPGSRYGLLVNGSDFASVLALPGIDGTRTHFNSAVAVASVLGIEAARVTIISEIELTMRNHGIELDRRHVMLLADLMTYRGEVLGITRNGLVKMKESVLLMASFEQTTDHLYEAAFFGQLDAIEGVSECIIMGIPMPIGTGMFKLIQNHEKAKQKRPQTLKREAKKEESVVDEVKLRI